MYDLQTSLTITVKMFIWIISYFGASYDAIILTHSKICQSETRTRPYVMSNSSYEIRHNFQHNSE